MFSGHQSQHTSVPVLVILTLPALMLKVVPTRYHLHCKVAIFLLYNY